MMEQYEYVLRNKNPNFWKKITQSVFIGCSNMANRLVLGFSSSQAKISRTK